MNKTCENCLNAYNSPFDSHVHCYNLDWKSQFDSSLHTFVSRNMTCSTWTRRNSNQNPLVFNMPIQLDLFSDLD